MIVNGINYTDVNTYYKTLNNNTSNSSFDSVFEAETLIYATPASNGLQSETTSNTSSSRPLSCPKDLDEIFKQAANKYGVSESLLKAVAKAESGFNANSESSGGAVGIMQLMPETASSLGVTNPYDATQNIMGGAKLLSQLLKKYNGNTSLALAAYNAGSGNVDKYNGIPPFRETQNYVQKILAYLNVHEDNNDTDIIYAVAANNVANTSQEYSVYAQPISSVNS